MILIQNRMIDIDILEELEEFEWDRLTIRGDEFFACSPFRKERKPSFSLNLQTGLYIDFGNNDDYYKTGNIVKLLAFLYDTSYAEMETTILQKYGIVIDVKDNLQLDLSLNSNSQQQINSSNLNEYSVDYLQSRGISEEVISMFEIKQKNDAVAFLWKDAKGNLINIKYRNIHSKKFYYEQNGEPVSLHLFGYDLIRKMKIKKVALCESEIDAMYLWTAGQPALAIGGSFLSKRQKQLILLAGIDEIILATDNDAAGKRLYAQIIKEIPPTISLKAIKFNDSEKDVNDMTISRLVTCLKNTVRLDMEKALVFH